MQKFDRQSGSKAGFDERKNASIAAKKQLLEKMLANKVDVNDPAFQERQAARQAAAAARAERDAQRKADKDAVKAQAAADLKAEQLRVELQAAADLAERQAKEAEAARLLIEQREQGKAARDARYAARKARR